MVIDDVDRQVWELLSNVPNVSKPVAVIQAIFNLVFPGVGTWITACAATENVSKTQLIIGLLQLLTAVVLIGWGWALYWSYLVIMKAFGEDQLLAASKNQYAEVNGAQFNGNLGAGAQYAPNQRQQIAQ